MYFALISIVERDRLIVMLLDLIIAAYVLLALSLIAHAIYDLIHIERDGRGSIPPNDESIDASDHPAVHRKHYERQQTWK